MISLLCLVGVIGLTIAFYVWRRPSLRHSCKDALVFTCLYCLSLGLALRFGGRTYPGIYFPNSSFLNDLLNGNGLFNGVGYLAVLITGAADCFLIFTRAMEGSPTKTLGAVKWIAVSLAMAIALFGLYCATVLQRLPS
jgi:hypothetical protein